MLRGVATASKSNQSAAKSVGKSKTKAAPPSASAAAHQRPAGQPQSVYFVSLGCPKNRVDTEVILSISDQAGYLLTDAPERADVIVVKTSGFFGAAKEE